MLGTKKSRIIAVSHHLSLLSSNLSQRALLFQVMWDCGVCEITTAGGVLKLFFQITGQVLAKSRFLAPHVQELQVRLCTPLEGSKCSKWKKAKCQRHFRREPEVYLHLEASAFGAERRWKHHCFCAYHRHLCRCISHPRSTGAGLYHFG